MTQKHTPAPWATYEGYDATVIRTTHRNAGEITPRAVAEALHHGEHHEQNGERTAYHQATDEDRANARLIAAAPELLEALKRLIPAAINSANSNDMTRGLAKIEKEFDNAIEQARAAIAKAEGKA